MTRRALTLLELVVVMAVIAILASLTVIGVQVGRESARRSQCISNLRQMGLALSNYENQYKVFPAGSSGYGSLHVAILPMIGEQSLSDQIPAPSPGASPLDAIQKKSVALFHCPSDSAGVWTKNGDFAATNYAGCAGVWQLSHGFNGMFRYSFPHVTPNGPVSTSYASNGLSNTVMLSEILHSDMSFARERVNWNTPKRFTAGSQLDEFANYCNAIPDPPSDYGWRGDFIYRGAPWISGGLGRTMYNHAFTPNSASCWNQTDVLSAGIAASSSHPGGVNCAFGDGHVEWIDDGIDASIWRTRGSCVDRAKE
jgi:prepilin-type N-terminal cleavage/methylation domain-containing protein/prepilin-type processing-associated H-X9-DG protein